MRRVRDVSFAPWIGVAYEAAWLMLESQWVVAARMARLAAGGALAQTEAQRMISEKSAAFVESTMMAAGALAGGKKVRLPPGKCFACTASACGETGEDSPGPSGAESRATAAR